MLKSEGTTFLFDELFGLRADLPDRVGPRAVAHKALVGRAQVDGDDVSVMDHALAGDAVDDLLVHRDAGGGGKARVAEAAGLGAGFHNELMYRLVNLLRCQTVADGLAAHGSCAGRDLCGLTHDLDFCSGLDIDRVGHVQIPRQSRIAAVVTSMVGWF